jgi:hypothetical protein
MSDETVLQDDLLQQIKALGIPAVVTESFPGTPGIQFQVLWIGHKASGKEYHLGFFIDKASTNGRIYYKSYSNEFKVDELFKAYSFGPTGELCAPLSDKINFALGMSLPLIFGYFDVTSENNSGINSISSLSFNTFTLGIEPGISVYYCHNGLNLGINLDYLFRFAASYNYSENYDASLKTRSGGDVNMGMTGGRLGFLIGYSF